MTKFRGGCRCRPSCGRLREHIRRTVITAVPWRPDDDRASISAHRYREPELVPSRGVVPAEFDARRRRSAPSAGRPRVHIRRARVSRYPIVSGSPNDDRAVVRAHGRPASKIVVGARARQRNSCRDDWRPVRRTRDRLRPKDAPQPIRGETRRQGGNHSENTQCDDRPQSNEHFLTSPCEALLGLTRPY